jgi:hypothetical protein
MLIAPCTLLTTVRIRYASGDFAVPEHMRGGIGGQLPAEVRRMPTIALSDCRA